MNFFKIRKARKELKELLHHARHVRHMHEDIADPELLAKLTATEELARAARKSGEVDVMETAGDALGQICLKMAPPRKQPKLRENVEVAFVAIAAAMAIRAYFFQPFKIPTGSMQPTLYGITIRQQEPDESTSFPTRLYKFISKGEVFVQYDTPFDRFAKNLFIGKPYTTRSTASGTIKTESMQQGGVRLIYRDNFNPGKVTIFVGNTPHTIPRALMQYCRFGEHIRAGDPLFKGAAKAGDYILVNRVKYNFVRPNRGDIVVFDARDVAREAYYIKRMVGLPDETISLDPPYLLVNGEKPGDTRFDKIFHNDNYSGYIFAGSGTTPPPLITGPAESIRLRSDEYLFFGDNTQNSLDGRYFGAVKQSRLLGSAFFVGLPFDRAGFAETSH